LFDIIKNKKFFEEYLTKHLDNAYAEKLILFAQFIFFISILFIICYTPFEINHQTFELSIFIMMGHIYAIILSITALITAFKSATKYEKLIKGLFYVTGIILLLFFISFLLINPFAINLGMELAFYFSLTPFLYILLYCVVFKRNIKFSQILSFIIIIFGFFGFFYFLQPEGFNINLAYHFLVFFSFIGIGFISINPKEGFIRLFCLNTSSSKLASYVIGIVSSLVILLLLVFFLMSDTYFGIMKNFMMGAFIAACVLGLVYVVIFVFVKTINTNDMNRIIEEEKAEEREELFEQLINFTNDAVVVTDKDNEIVYANPKFYEYFGLEENSLLGRNFLDPSLGMFQKKEAYLKACENFSTEFLQEHKVNDEKNIILSGYIIPIIKNDELEGVIQVAVDVTEFKENESNLKSSMDLMNVLLTEVHHRVKNNMQIIISLLNLQKYQIQDPAVKNALDESKSRIKAMSLVHENLYVSGNFSQINIKEYTNLLVESLKSQFSYIPNIIINQDIIDYTIDLDTAIPLGLIINEIITGCIYYGFDEGRYLEKHNITGLINLKLSKKDNDFTLEMYDNGPELPQNEFGITPELIEALSSQLNGKSEITMNDEGFTFILKFSLKE
jgi:PAS domain S-box-containing protein